MKKQIVAGALAVLGWTGASSAQEPPRPVEPGAMPFEKRLPESPNQRMANAIARYLEASGQFKDAQLDVAFTGGVAELCGKVNNFIQHAEAIRIVRTIPGVMAVHDRLIVATAQMPPHGMPPMMTPGHLPTPPVVAAQGIGPPPGPPPGPLPEGPGALPEPLSIMPVPMGPNPAYNPPPMPPYAWPTYAPYNNLSRVAYPKLYPYEAWPFIGPMYPFPKVPPGWRGVSLRWQDGYWWYGRDATGHDWWRVRYW